MSLIFYGEINPKMQNKSSGGGFIAAILLNVESITFGSRNNLREEF